MMQNILTTGNEIQDAIGDVFDPGLATYESCLAYNKQLRGDNKRVGFANDNPHQERLQRAIQAWREVGFPVPKIENTNPAFESLWARLALWCDAWMNAINKVDESHPACWQHQDSNGVSLVDDVVLLESRMFALCLDDDIASCGCGRRFGDSYLNVGQTHYAICETHRCYWAAGANLFSCWRDENETVWSRNREILATMGERD